VAAQVLPVALGVAAGAAVTQRDVEPAVVAEGQAAPPKARPPPLWLAKGWRTKSSRRSLPASAWSGLEARNSAMWVSPARSV
jgi:hypothetical protein